MLCGCMYVCMYVHRKLGATEINNGDVSMHRSKAYPLCVGLDAYAHFGLGTGIYFLQILGLVVVMSIGGSILIPNMMAFGVNDDWFISFTGACDNEGIQYDIHNIYAKSISVSCVFHSIFTSTIDFSALITSSQ